MTLKEKKKLSIVVSHPGKQYVHELLNVLQQEGHLKRFLTSIWYKPSLPLYRFFLRIPIVGTFLFQKFLKKKTYFQQKDELIEQYPWPEFWRQCLVQLYTRFRTEKYVFQVETKHDQLVAKRLETLKPDVFIGYEKSSLQSFQTVKKQGGITILDLAQVHYEFLQHLRATQETFQDLFEDPHLFDVINKVKKEEYQYADYIWTLSEFAKSTLVTYGINEKKIRVMSLGYNPAIFFPKKYEQQTYHAEAPLRLIYTGTFTKRKGVHLLLQAISELALHNVSLTIIGPILDGQELFDAYKGLFKHYDFMHHEELVKHLQESDVYVFPSLLDSWAMTVVEAMACGLPAIVTENTGAKDAVEDGKSGFVIPIADITALKEKIMYFYENRVELKRMGQNAVQSAQHFQWSSYHKQINEFINELQ